jgi:hypothetical protein
MNTFCCDVNDNHYLVVQTLLSVQRGKKACPAQLVRDFLKLLIV